MFLSATFVSYNCIRIGSVYGSSGLVWIQFHDGIMAWTQIFRISGSWWWEFSSHQWFPSPWWRHQIETFSALLALCAGNSLTGHRWIPLTKASDADLWCFLWSAPWINGWVNNREAGDLRRHCAHYDVIVMRRIINTQLWCFYAVSALAQSSLLPFVLQLKMYITCLLWLQVLGTHTSLLLFMWP